ncbi:MAG: GNAT family N-acetyltransferase [Rhodobacteraceae bacterium]|jgi:GNAT superfamily N-acetyltransferase|nr:GNAT family N-acetyltransferase [Paracoccaceae bacterium]
MIGLRTLDPVHDLQRVAEFYDEAGDYWLLADRRPHDAQKARDFFTDAPPGCDPAASQRLGLFLSGRLSGVVELSFGFPAPGDAYLGLMLLSPRIRSGGTGRLFLREIEARARVAGSRNLYLAVLDENPRGRAFWLREGFTPTGLSGTNPDTGHRLERLLKPL